MFRFLHTADWQMGMVARGAAAVADRISQARLDALEDLLAQAGDHRVQAILCAGDQFEDNHVPGAISEAVVDRLASAGCAVYLIPGNHDPYTRDSLYRRPPWTHLPENVHLLVEPAAVEIAAGVTLWPCPLVRKSGFEDPTAWIPPREGSDGLRIGLAHGTLAFSADIGGEAFPIPPDAAQRCELDYLALGHWHSRLSVPADDPAARTWYSGTHEPTAFGERDSGGALLVTLEEPGRPAEVQPLKTARLTWRTERVDLSAEPLAELIQRLRRTEDAQATLLRLELHGQAEPDDGPRFIELQDLLDGRFLYADVNTAAVVPAEAADLLAELPAETHIQRTVEQLQALAEGDQADPSPEVARRALQWLQQLAHQTHGQGGER